MCVCRGGGGAMGIEVFCREECYSLEPASETKVAALH